jgi:hypothetical protein
VADAGHVRRCVISYSALDHRLHSDPASDGLYVVALRSGEQFFARVTPRLFDCNRRPMPEQHVSPESAAKLHIDDEGWLLAVQVLELINDCPF